MRKLLPLLPLLLAVALPAAVSAQTAGTTRSVTAGVYTDVQAVRGDTAFQKFCLSCHTPSSYADDTFRANWFGRSVFDLFKTLKTTMPEDNIGGLSDDEYTRVIAYILKLNGFPAGADSLPSDSATTSLIRIGPDGATSKGTLKR